MVIIVMEDPTLVVNMAATIVQQIYLAAITPIMTRIFKVDDNKIKFLSTSILSNLFSALSEYDIDIAYNTDMCISLNQLKSIAL